MAASVIFADSFAANAPAAVPESMPRFNAPDSTDLIRSAITDRTATAHRDESVE